MENLPTHQYDTTIGIFAPAGWVTEEQIEPAFNILSQKGFRIKKSPNLFGKFRFFSGTIQTRLEDIHYLLDDPDIKILYAVRGGVGCSQLLPHVDYRLWKETGKLLIGFSDVTALQWALYKKCGLPSLSGMTLTNQCHKENPYLNLFFDILSGKVNSIQLNKLVDSPLKVWRNGKAEGILIGGTLSILNTVLGTPFFPDLNSIILFIEEINEPLYKIERNLIQLKLAGILEKVKGLILGSFYDQEKKIEIWPEVDYLFPTQIPVVSNFPYGHFPDACPLPLGVYCTFKSSPFEIKW
jgi:muramoyltetrapeptide carboxypeptidase